MIHRVNWRCVRTHFDYPVADLAKAINVSRSTIRNWVRKKGLPIRTDLWPHMIEGHAFRAWYRTQIDQQKKSCSPGEMHCMSCNQPRKPALGMVDYVPFSVTRGNLHALCDVCGGNMRQLSSAASLPRRMPGVDVAILAVNQDTNQ